MELSELVEETKKILQIDDILALPERLMQVVMNNEVEVYNSFCEMVNNDLSVDYLQKIFQYWMADSIISESIYNLRLDYYRKQGYNNLDSQIETMKHFSQLYNFVFREVT